MTTNAQNTKISPNFPARKSLGKCTVSADPWASPPENLQRRRTKTKKRKTNKKKQTKKHWETRRNLPILRNEQIQNVYKNQNFFFRYIPES